MHGSTRALPKHSRVECSQWTSASRVARRAVGLHVPDPATFRDAFIGATALVHDMTVVTRDLKNFRRFDELDVINPWS